MRGARESGEQREHGAPGAGGSRGRAGPGAAAPPRARQPAAHRGALRRHRQLLWHRADRDYTEHAPHRRRVDARGERTRAACRTHTARSIRGPRNPNVRHFVSFSGHV